MKAVIKVTIFSMFMVTILNAGFGATERDCAISSNTYTKYANRVVKSLQIVGKADKVDIDLSIKYGIDTLSDCDKYMSKTSLEGIRKQVKYFSGTK